MGNSSVIIDFRIVAHAPQQPIHDARRPPRSARNLMRAAIVDLNIEDTRRSFADRFQILVRVKVQMKVDSKAAAQRRRNQTLPRGRADQSELWQLKLDRSRARPLPD